MKYALTALVVLFSLGANAQLQRRFDIDPVVLQRTFITTMTTIVEASDTATSVGVFISANDKDSAHVNYILYDANNQQLKFGVRTVALTAAQILLVFPINIATLNANIFTAVNVDALTEL